jgi:hypothetical protein
LSKSPRRQLLTWPLQAVVNSCWNRSARFQKAFEKFYAGAIRFSMSRVAARSMSVSDVCTLYS